jgi:hypothetical protein
METSRLKCPASFLTTIFLLLLILLIFKEMTCVHNCIAVIELTIFTILCQLKLKLLQIHTC